MGSVQRPPETAARQPLKITSHQRTDTRSDAEYRLRAAAIVEQCWHRVPGGTANATVRTLSALAKRDDTELLGVSAFHRSAPVVSIPTSIPVQRMPLPRRALYDSWHYLRWPRLQRFTGKLDVIHATGGVVPPSGNAAIVVTVHDLAFLRRPDWFTPRGVRFATKAFQLTRRNADLILVPSQATRRDCVDHGVAHDRIRVVHWGVNVVDVTKHEVDAVRQRYRLPDTFALWVGTAEPRKNLATLLDAATRTISGVPLVLVGPPGWGLNLDALISGTSATVIRLGFVESYELAALYTAARVFVYPSLMEGFGLPVLEAMAQGTPVVTSEGTATSEVCADPASTVDPLDAESLAAAIDAVVTDDSEHARRSEAARARAAQLTWAATAEQVRRAYAEVSR